MRRETKQRKQHALGLVVGVLPLLFIVGAHEAAGQGAPPPAAPGAARPKEPAPDLDLLAATTGLKGTMHGSKQVSGTYVFTWWNPKSFFQNTNLSLVPMNPDIERQLAALERHQSVVVWGKLVRVTPGQTHVRVEKVEVGEKWHPGVTAEVIPRKPSEDLTRKLARKKHVDAMVHAVAEDGSALAIEYAGEVIPVQVPPTEALRKQVAGLFRGDRIRFRSSLAKYPVRPAHLMITPDPDDDRSPLEVKDAIHDQHEKARTVEGHLVLFPKSPVLRRSIWGVEERGPNGLDRYFTIFNFEDAKDQAKIDAILQAAWDSSAKGVKDARNKYVHTKVKVRVTGQVNNPAPNQANPTVVTHAVQVEVTQPRRLRPASNAAE